MTTGLPSLSLARIRSDPVIIWMSVKPAFCIMSRTCTRSELLAFVASAFWSAVCGAVVDGVALGCVAGVLV